MPDRAFVFLEGRSIFSAFSAAPFLPADDWRTREGASLEQFS